MSYEARAVGVKRIMRGAEAKRVCPEMILVQVPTSHGKADLTIYREASAKILKVLGQRYSSSSVVIERASIDEVYLDVTAEAARLLREHDPATFISTFVDYVRNAPTLIAGADTKEMKMSKADIRNGYAGQGVAAVPPQAIDQKDRAEDPEAIHTLGANDQTEDQSEAEESPSMAAAVAANDSVADTAWFDRPDYQWSLEDRMLLAGTVIIQQLRKDVWDHLGFTCSAGIAVNKMLSKLASGMHKPNKQTLVPGTAVKTIIDNLPYSRVQGFGGKLGHEITKVFGEEVQTMSHLLALPRDQLVRNFGQETTQWILQRAQGIDYDVVQDRSLPISIGCSKSFRSTNMLTPQHLQDGTVLFWLTELANELHERVLTDTETNNRKPKQLHVGASVYIRSASAAAKPPHSSRPDSVAQWWEEQGVSLSKTANLPPGGAAAIAKLALSLISRAIQEHPRIQQEIMLSQGGKTWGITSMGVSVANFDKIESGKKSIFSYLKAASSADPLTSQGLQPQQEKPLKATTAVVAQKPLSEETIRMLSWMEQSQAPLRQLSQLNNAASSISETDAAPFAAKDGELDLEEINDAYVFSTDAYRVPTGENSRSLGAFAIDGEPLQEADSSKPGSSVALDEVILVDDEDGDGDVASPTSSRTQLRPLGALAGEKELSTTAHLRAMHAKYLRHVDIDMFLSLPPDVQQELLNEAMFHQQSSASSAATVGHKRPLASSSTSSDNKR